MLDGGCKTAHALFWQVMQFPQSEVSALYDNRSELQQVLAEAHSTLIVMEAVEVLIPDVAIIVIACQPTSSAVVVYAVLIEGSLSHLVSVITGLSSSGSPVEYTLWSIMTELPTSTKIVGCGTARTGSLFFLANTKENGCPWMRE